MIGDTRASGAHHVERFGQLAEFVTRENRHDLVEVAGGDAQGGFLDCPNRLQRRPDRLPRRKSRQAAGCRETEAEPDERRGGGSTRVLAGVFHGLLVELQNRIGQLLNLAECVV